MRNNYNNLISFWSSRETFEEYAKNVEKLAFRLLELIALSLNLPPKKFNIFFENANSLLRLNHYPPCPNPDLVLGVGRHKDPGALTVLYQDSTGGLDVKRWSDGEWIRVKPIPDAFIINVGDVFQVFFPFCVSFCFSPRTYDWLIKLDWIGIRYVLKLLIINIIYIDTLKSKDPFFLYLITELISLLKRGRFRSTWHTVWYAKKKNLWYVVKDKGMLNRWSQVFSV